MNETFLNVLTWLGMLCICGFVGGLLAALAVVAYDHVAAHLRRRRWRS